MALLVIGTETVPVAAGTTRAEFEEVGDRYRAFDGTLRSSVRGRKRRINATTIPMTASVYSALETAVNATPPVTCSGDLLGGSVSCHPRILDARPVKLEGETRWVAELEVLEV